MNFEELGKKVKQFGKDTVEEVQRMNEIRQLNGKMNDAKRQIDALYAEMGKKLYEQYKDVLFAGFETEIGTIKEKSRLIEELKEQIRVVKGVVLCPCCNMEVGENERFCSNCGNRMPEVEPADAQEPEAEAKPEEYVDAGAQDYREAPTEEGADAQESAAAEESAAVENTEAEEGADVRGNAAEESAAAQESAAAENADAQEIPEAESAEGSDQPAAEAASEERMEAEKAQP